MTSKNLITQHRRGTNEEWEKTSEIPKDGELLIERGTGVPKLKIGNGNSEYSDLPYITDAIEADLATERTRINNLIAGTGAEGSWEKEVEDIRVIGDTIYESAGDAVRSIYNNVKDFIGEASVNGLEYNREGDYKLYLTNNGNRVGNGVEIKGGSGGSDTSVVSLEVITESEFAVTSEQRAYIEFRFTSKIDGIATGTFQYKLLNGNNGILEAGSYKQSSEYISLDVTKYLVEGDNIIRLRCEDVYSNYRLIEFKITQINFRIDTSEDLIQVIEDDNLSFTCKALGDTAQTLHIILRDNTAEAKKWIDFETSDVPYNTAVSYPFDLSGITSRGVYDLEIYSVTTIKETTLTSNILNHKILLTKGSTTPLIGAICEDLVITTADRLVIPFKVYDPEAASSPSECVVLTIKHKNDRGQYTTLGDSEYRNNINLNLIQYWYLPELPAGDIELSLRYYPIDSNSDGYENDTFYEELYYLTVMETLKPTLVPGYTVNLNAYGKSNGDLENRDKWISEVTSSSGTGVVTKVEGTLTGCNWTNNGWLSDSGIPYLRLFGDARLELDYAPFSKSNYDIYSGLTVELDFAVRDVNVRNKTILQCLGETGAGISATCDTLTISSTNKDGLRTNYKENERLKLALVITPPYNYLNTSSDFLKNDPQFLSIYVNGVLSSTTKYIFDKNSLADGSNSYFYHDGKLKFGDSSCTLDIYSIRTYPRALSSNEVLRNYIAELGADRSTVLSKNAYYKYDSQNNPIDIVYGLTDYNKIKDFIPTILFTGEMPPKKGDKRVVYMDFINPNDTSRSFSSWYKDKGYEQGKGIKVEIDVQGTSSQFYVRKNWKVKMKKKSKNKGPNGETLYDFKYDRYQHMENQISSDVFCLKVDYAEATGTHNTQNANFIESLYSEFDKLPAQKDDPRVRTTIAGFPCVIFERLTESDTPLFSSKSNFNFDKDSEDAFGFTKDYDVECWEFCNNDPVCTFKKDFDSKYSWLNNFEPRYTQSDFDTLEELEEEIKDNQEAAKTALREEYNNLQAGLDPNSEEYKNLEAEYVEKELEIYSVINEYKYSSDYTTLVNLRTSMIAQFKEVFDWVRSTDTNPSPDADNYFSPNKFLAPIKYGTVTYEYDTIEYRRAKFKYEFTNWFDLDYAKIYYVYTFFALMTDQRAKNMFLTRWGNKWYPYFYDNDTCFGINNSGAIAFDYQYEDTQVGVYNGRDSVLWNNFRECFSSEISATYNKLRNPEAPKLTYNLLIDRFINQGSSKWTPSIYNEDAEYKYVSMARPENATLNIASNTYTVDLGNLNQVRGTGDLHLKYFLANRLDYCDSKWKAASYLDDKIEIRLMLTSGEDAHHNGSPVKPSTHVTLTSYMDMYGGIKYRAEGEFEHKQLKANIPSDFGKDLREEYGDDVDTAICGASKLKSLGDLSNLYLRRFVTSSASRLTELIIGNRAVSYYNDLLNEVQLSNSTLLQKVVLSNCRKLGTEVSFSSLDLSSCPNIKEVYLDGTVLSGCSLPEAGYLETYVIPNTFTELKITNQPNLDLGSIQIQDKNLKDITNTDFDQYLSSIQTLNIQSVGEAVNSTLTPFELFRKFCNRDTSLTTVNINNIEWRDCKVEDLISLYTDKNNGGYGMTNITLNGNCYITYSDATLHDPYTNNYFINGDIISDIREHIRGVNFIFPSDIFVKSNIYFYDGDGKTLLKTTQTASQNIIGTSIKYPSDINPIKASDKEYNYTWIQNGWSTIKDSTQVDDNALTNILGDRVLYPVFKKTVREYTVSFYTGSTLLYSIALPALDASNNPTKITYDANKIQDKSLITEEGYPKNVDSINSDNYIFAGWDPELDENSILQGNITYHAKFIFNYYELKLDDLTYSINNNNITVEKIITTNQAAIKLPASLTIDGIAYSINNIKSEALANIKENLEALDMSATSITSIPSKFLQNSTSLIEISLPSYVKTIGALALQKTSIHILDIPSTVTESGALGYLAFADCANLTTVYIRAENPSSSLCVQYDGRWEPFRGCTNIETFYVGWDSTYIVNGSEDRWGANKTASIEYYEFDS